MDLLEVDSATHAYSVNQAMEKIASEGKGVIVLLHRPESARELLVRAMPEAETPLQQKWDARSYGIGAQILKDIGVGKMRLLATQRKLPSLAGFDLEVTGYSDAA
jgi:3,4-dihydroxy 2-butanone 4-phosphate synthase/GTP cyclohydrolase II